MWVQELISQTWVMVILFTAFDLSWKSINFILKSFYRKVYIQYIRNVMRNQLWCIEWLISEYRLSHEGWLQQKNTALTSVSLMFRKLMGRRNKLKSVCVRGGRGQVLARSRPIYLRGGRDKSSVAGLEIYSRGGEGSMIIRASNLLSAGGGRFQGKLQYGPPHYSH